MSINDFVTVNLKVGRKMQTIKMERGTCFENQNGIFVADEDGKSLKINNYQMDVFIALANNYQEKKSKEIILSKKDIEISMQQYNKGTIIEDLSECLSGLYKIKNPKVNLDENKISVYVTNNKPSTSAKLSFSYNPQIAQINKKDALSAKKISVTEKKEENIRSDINTQYKVFNNKNVIEKKAFKYTVKIGENLESIAKKYELDTYQLIAANPQLKQGRDYNVKFRKNNMASLESTIKAGTTITIPARYSVKEGSVRNFSDLCKITGLSYGYIKDLLTVIEVKASHPGKPDLTTYNDGYGMPTIGYGHTGKVDGKALSLKQKITITESKALQLLAEDLIKHEAMVMAYLGKANYEKTPASVRAAILDVAYNKGIWDGFLNPNHNSSTSKIKSDLEKGNYASALCHTRRMNTASRGLKRRNVYRFISGLEDLTPAKRESAMNEMNNYYKSVLNVLKGAEREYLLKAWENAKSGKVTGYRIQYSQHDR